MSSEIEDTEVLRALYAGSADGFDAFLRRLAQAVRASGARLAVGDDAQWRLGLAPDLPTGALRDGRVYSQGDLPGSDVRDPPLRLVAAPGGVRLAVQRRHDDFRAADSALLSRLAPHLETSAVLWRQRQRQACRASRDARLAGALGGGWLVLDAALRVIDASPGAARLLARAGLTLGADGWLDHPPRDLRRAVEGVLAGEGPHMLTLSATPLVELAIRAEGGLALGLLRAEPTASAVPGLSRALGLTRAEGRLVAALADGATLAEAAVALGWSVETARSTSKQVFSKLGVSSQPALVRRVLNGALWLTA